MYNNVFEDWRLMKYSKKKIETGENIHSLFEGIIYLATFSGEYENVPTFTQLYKNFFTLKQCVVVEENVTEFESMVYDIIAIIKKWGSNLLKFYKNKPILTKTEG